MQLLPLVIKLVFVIFVIRNLPTCIANNSYDIRLDLVIMSQYRGEETKNLFRALPQYFSLHKDRTRVAILFSDRKPYIGLNFTHDNNRYQQGVESSNGNDADNFRSESGDTALKLAREQLFVDGITRNDSMKAIIYVQNSIGTDAFEEVDKLRSLNVHLYVLCMNAFMYRPKRFPVAKVCRLLGRSDCIYYILHPKKASVGEVFRMINETIEQKFRDNSSICGNGTGMVSFDEDENEVSTVQITNSSVTTSGLDQSSVGLSSDQPHASESDMAQMVICVVLLSWFLH